MVSKLRPHGTTQHARGTFQTGEMALMATVTTPLASLYSYLCTDFAIKKREILHTSTGY
jgi:hypothetical protein